MKNQFIEIFFMPLKGTGTLIFRKSGQYYTYWIYLSKELVRDSQFPFEEKDALRIKIQEKRLIIEKNRDDK